MDLIRCRVGYKGNGRSTGEYNQHRRALAAVRRALSDVEGRSQQHLLLSNSTLVIFKSGSHTPFYEESELYFATLGTLSSSTGHSMNLGTVVSRFSDCTFSPRAKSAEP